MVLPGEKAKRQWASVFGVVYFMLVGYWKSGSIFLFKRFGSGKYLELIRGLEVRAAVTLDAVIKFSEAIILALVFPNMIGLFFLFPKVKEELDGFLKQIESSKD